jgi:hypothetical protein
MGNTYRSMSDTLFAVYFVVTPTHLYVPLHEVERICGHPYDFCEADDAAVYQALRASALQPPAWAFDKCAGSDFDPELGWAIVRPGVRT